MIQHHQVLRALDEILKGDPATFRPADVLLAWLVQREIESDMQQNVQAIAPCSRCGQMKAFNGAKLCIACWNLLRINTICCDCNKPTIDGRAYCEKCIAIGATGVPL